MEDIDGDDYKKTISTDQLMLINLKADLDLVLG
jgi:hypothetical protein